MTDKLLKISNTHDGRDKFCKAVQYMLKIIISSSTNKETIEWLTPVFSKFILIRSSQRFKKNI